MMSGITEALKGIGGGYELTRVVGAIGGLSYIISANVFVAWNIGRGQDFDVTAYCLAFPSGLAAVVAAIAGGAAWKDKGVASAKVIQDTGAVPAPPPEGPRVPVEPMEQTP